MRLLKTRPLSGDLLPFSRVASDDCLIACVDEPGEPEYAPRDPSSCRFSGWVVSRRNRATTIIAKVAGAEPREFKPTVARPDVVQALAETCRVENPVCGFRFELDLSHMREDGAPVRLEFTDGDSVLRSATYRICDRRPSASSTPPRAAYKDVWNAASQTEDHAKISVAGYTDEQRFRETAAATVRVLRASVGIQPEDVVLEIGAGVGRVGQALAPICRKWIGTDVSENMLRHARRRLRKLKNVELIATNGWNLDAIASASVDVVYCTVVFMHLDEWDRYNYVREGLRILRPGGRMYADNFNLLGEAGWQFFLKHADEIHPLDRPPNISKSSTPQELQVYFQRAGFVDVQVVSGDMWVYAHGKKPG